MADKKNTLEAEVNRRTGNPVTSRVYGSELGGSWETTKAASRATLEDLDAAQRRNEWNKATRNYCKGGKVISTYRGR